MELDGCASVEMGVICVKVSGGYESGNGESSLRMGGAWMTSAARVEMSRLA